MHLFVVPGALLPFPQVYPVGCLLGCVNVDDCLEQDVYRQQVCYFI